VNDAFFCPNAFDLSFWGLKGDLDSKTLTVSFEATSPSAIEGKELLLLVNSKKVVYGGGENSQQPEVKAYTQMQWLPLSATSPIQTTLTYARERVY